MAKQPNVHITAKKGERTKTFNLTVWNNMPVKDGKRYGWEEVTRGEAEAPTPPEVLEKKVSLKPVETEVEPSPLPDKGKNKGGRPKK